MRLRRAGCDCSIQRVLIEAGIGAHVLGCCKIRDQQVDRAVALGLDDQLAFELQRSAEQHGERDGFGQQPRDGGGIIVPAENGVEHRAELHGTAAHIQTFDLERQDMVVAGKADFTEFQGTFSHHRSAPSHAMRRREPSPAASDSVLS